MRARWIRSAGSLALVAALLPSLALADAAETLARRHFKAAQAAYDLGQFEAALQGYSQAYEAKPLPAFLFNIAQCHKQLGHWERASFFFRRFQTLAPPGSDLEMVRTLIAQVEQKRAEEEARSVEEKDSAALQQHTLELERAREATARAEAEAAAQRAAEAAAAAKLLESKPPEVPLYQRWWLWAGVGAVVAAGAVTSVAIVTRPRPEDARYGTVNAR